MIEYGQKISTVFWSDAYCDLVIQTYASVKSVEERKL